MNQPQALDTALSALALDDKAIAALQQCLREHLMRLRHGDAQMWENALAQLPPATTADIDLSSACVRIGTADGLKPTQRTQLENALQALHPWRKGPFDLFGIHIDSEWRSDWKWDRVAAHITDLAGRAVLDVGCGNGYYAWRMLGCGARCVLGVDPTLRFLAQFRAMQHYLRDPRVLLLPLRGEDLPAELGCFDTAFSMGVLYHRRAPLDHLIELRETLRPGGQLVLETLVVDGDQERVLMPADRYAKMSNVWFIPTARALLLWLARCGFRNPRIVDISATTTLEQRRTPWMRFESLADFLDPNDSARTLEGYPAPVRAILLAEKPA